jgi:DNA (cytosine-5)-methyltransferase 1
MERGKSNPAAGPKTVLSCFSGVGGLDLGLEAAGFESVGCLEIDPSARAALGANRPRWPLLDVTDVVAAGSKLRPQDLGLEARELTLIAGGPPCQPFSKAAQWAAPKKGVTDSRGTTVGGMLELIESFLPAAVVIENVSGFLFGKNNAAPIINAAFGEINAANKTRYRLLSWIVDAADYGVPQHRRRMIAVAFRDDVVDGLELPKTHSGAHRTAWDALGDDRPDNPPAATGKYADLLACIPEGYNYQYLTRRGGGPSVELFGYRTKFWSFLLKLAKDKPAWTLPASPGPSTGPFHWDNRPLTSSERLLLQGFPADWKLVSDERINARLTGNATPPPLAEATGRFVSCLIQDGKRQPDAPGIAATVATPARGQPVPRAARPRPLPTLWKAKVGPRAAHPGAGLGPGAHPMDS